MKIKQHIVHTRLQLLVKFPSVLAKQHVCVRMKGKMAWCASWCLFNEHVVLTVIASQTVCGGFSSFFRICLFFLCVLTIDYGNTYFLWITTSITMGLMIDALDLKHIYEFAKIHEQFSKQLNEPSMGFLIRWLVLLTNRLNFKITRFICAFFGRFLEESSRIVFRFFFGGFLSICIHLLNLFTKTFDTNKINWKEVTRKISYQCFKQKK